MKLSKKPANLTALLTKNKLPKYVDCKNNKDNCQWYMHKACRNSCHYALDIQGVGAADQGTANRIQSGLDKLMKDVGRKGDY